MRSSKPRFPGEIRANLSLCLQAGHIGRSKIEFNLLTVTFRNAKFTQKNDKYSLTDLWCVKKIMQLSPTIGS